MRTNLKKQAKICDFREKPVFWAAMKEHLLRRKAGEGWIRSNDERVLQMTGDAFAVSEETASLET